MNDATNDRSAFINRTRNESSYSEPHETYLQSCERFHKQEYEDQPFMFCSRQVLSPPPSLFRIKLYEKILGMHGAIVECGAHHGNNFMLFNQLASIYESYNLPPRSSASIPSEGLPRSTMMWMLGPR